MKRDAKHNEVASCWCAVTLCVLTLLAETESSAIGQGLDLGTIHVDVAAPPSATAPNPTTIAPTSVPLSATQPTSVINEQYIRNAVPPTGSYDTIAAIAPSVLSVAPNGPGLGDAAAVTIRGFMDGQYNVTFDGIPFADSDDFTHHTDAYFAAHALRLVAVDRGPGTAATVGDATFGGTVSLLSRDPTKTSGGEAYTSFGSFGTRLFGVEADTGAIQSMNGGAYLIDVEHSNSNGYLTNTAQDRTSFFFKGVQPVGDRTVLTMVINTQWLSGGQTAGATRAQLAAYGPNFNLSNNPDSQNYAGYNQQSYRTDFDYLGVQSQVTDDLTLDNKVYTYALYRHFNSGADVNGEQPNGTAYGAQNVPGLNADNGFRAYGDVLKLEDSLPFGVLRGGFWVEHQANNRAQYTVDETLGGILNPVLAPVAGVPNSPAIVRQQQDTLNSAQPFVELDWHVTPRLTVTVGLKYAVFTRGEDSPVNEGTRLPLNTEEIWAAPLPSIAVHYRIQPGWAAYVQVARGFLAPQLQFLDVPDPKADAIAPESTVNYQIGTNVQRGRFALAADGYYINFDNLVGNRTVGGETQVFNEGGVNYLGLEGEGTVRLGGGLSLYGNASVNSARQKSDGAPVPNTPQGTMAGGLIFARDAWSGSLIDKWVGGRFGDTDRQQWLQPFNQLDFNLGWRWEGRPGVAPPIKLQLMVQNLLDSRKVDYLAGYTATDNTPLYFTQAGRGVFLNVAALF